MALVTVQDYVARARTLLMDLSEPYRYTNEELAQSLSDALLEARRLRPDLMSSYFDAEIPQFTAADLASTVPIDPQYRVAFVYYICGQAQLRDDEDNQDQRASLFLNKFTAQMLTIQS